MTPFDLLLQILDTFGLEHLQRIACDVMKLFTKFKRNRPVRGGVIAISVFDLMTLNMFGSQINNEYYDDTNNGRMAD